VKSTGMKLRLTLTALIFAVGAFALAVPRGASAAEPFDTVVRYTEALRTGDTVGVQSQLGGRLYEKKKLLLEENDEYPDFLRRFYQGAEFSVSSELNDLGPRGLGVDFAVHFPGGNSSEYTAIVEQGDDGSWKIVDEIEVGN